MNPESRARSQYLDDTVWYANTTCAHCEYLVPNTDLRTVITTIIKTLSLAVMEKYYPASVIRVVEQIDAEFALRPFSKLDACALDGACALCECVSLDSV